MEGSKERKSTFKGVRIIHGAVKDRLHASWRLYEEPGSKSGLPEIVRLLLVVQCDAEFVLRLSLSVKAGHPSSFGIPRTLTAREGSSYQVPNAATISSMERVARLRHMMNVADRAATLVESAKKLERGFTQSINKNPKKKALIREATDDEGYVQEWTDIADASKSDSFHDILRDKLFRMEALELHQLRREIEQETGEARRREYDVIERPATRERSRYRASPPPPRRRFRSPSPILVRSARTGGFRMNAVDSFSAVGPGYKVARMS